MEVKPIKLDDLLDENKAKKQEMATVCSLKRDQLGIIIEVESEDHGNLDPEHIIFDAQSPAHAHVYGSNRSDFLGFLNITGPCPKREADVMEYRKPVNSKFTKGIKFKIVKWANSKWVNPDGSITTKWINAQNTWRTFQYDK
jgi:hypothetical protein